MIKFLVSAMAVFCIANGVVLIVKGGDFKTIALAVLFMASGVVLFEARFWMHGRE